MPGVKSDMRTTMQKAAGNDLSAWDMFWGCHVVACGCLGIVDPRKLMPVMYESMGKCLCLNRGAACNCGEKGKPCALPEGGLCFMAKGVYCCCTNVESSCYCEGCCTPAPESYYLQNNQANYCRCGEDKSCGMEGKSKCCCVRTDFGNGCFVPKFVDNQAKICEIEQRCCCCYLFESIRGSKDIGGDSGLISCVERHICCVQDCVLPPKNMFVELVGVRVMGPPKTQDIYKSIDQPFSVPVPLTMSPPSAADMTTGALSAPPRRGQ